MKKIYINNTKRAIVFGKTVLVPGTNVVEAIDKEAFPLLETLIDEDEIEVSENPASAMKKANTRETVKALEGIGKDDENTKAAAKKRTKQLDKIDEEVAAAAKAKKESEKEDSEEEGV